MSLWSIALRSLSYYRRTNFAIALGVAAATAVLTGALIVGDSMRYSLRSLTIERLGKIDEMLVSDGFFREKLADEIKQTAAFQGFYAMATPTILFPGGTVETNIQNQPKRRAGRVAVLGITDEFWSLGDPDLARKGGDSGEPARSVSSTRFPGESSVIINQSLADDLQISPVQVADGSAKLTLRIPKQNQLPADSALGKKTDLIESLVDLQVVEIIPTTGLGRFGLHPTQSDPMNIYVPIGLLQESLSRTVLKHKSDRAQANVVLLSGSEPEPPSPTASEKLRRELRPTLADYGLSLKRVVKNFGEGEKRTTVFDYWSLSADRMVLTDRASATIQSAFPDAKPVFTYLANDIRRTDNSSGVPFSMVAAIDFDTAFQPDSAKTGAPIPPLGENEIVLNEWAAKDSDAEVGDNIAVTYFEPETTHGTQVETTVELRLAGVATFTEPIEPYVVPLRGPIEPAEFAATPEVTNDPDLTPEVPGVTDSETIENWDLPFDTADKIRSQDDEYWSNHRTTPKAFVSLATGQKLWSSRFGQTTSFRIPLSAGDFSQISSRLLEEIASEGTDFGLQLVPIKRRGLTASAGSTPFDGLFLALSMFVIGAALILVSLLFRLGFQQRASEVGVLAATGFDQKGIRRLWLGEMSVVCLIGAVAGVILGIGYARLMIWGLSTWWVGAISRPFLQLHFTPLSLFVGLLSGLLVCIATVAWSLRIASRQNVRNLLAGEIETSNSGISKQKNSRPWLVLVLLLAAIGLAAWATNLSGESQSGSFLGAGFLVLTALLFCVYRWLKSPAASPTILLNIASLAVTNAKRNPLRSTLTIGLVAVAGFLIAAVSAFRLAPQEQGTGGFDWVAQSSQPILEDLSTEAAQVSTLGPENQLLPGTKVVPLRYKSGEDASCNNLYQSTQPQVLGVPPAFVEYFEGSADDDDAERRIAHSFAWAGSKAESVPEKTNPWHLLAGTAAHAGTESDPIPVVMDKNTANYSLKIFSLDTQLKVEYDSGETVHFRVVGLLTNTILQGSLLIAERDFVSAFPSIGGYQYFLIHDGKATATSDRKNNAANSPANSRSNVEILESRLSDYGFDARPAPQILAGFMSVQNTYLSTFQTLGALGLLLGTFGLAAVQMRNVLERKKELGLMRAVGFSRGRLGAMVLLENGFLLVTGLLVGIAAAMFTTLPHWMLGNASVPWGELALMFATIVIIGILASSIASRQISKLPLLESLRT